MRLILGAATWHHIHVNDVVTCTRQYVLIVYLQCTCEWLGEGEGGPPQRDHEVQLKQSAHIEELCRISLFLTHFTLAGWSQSAKFNSRQIFRHNNIIRNVFLQRKLGSCTHTHTHYFSAEQYLHVRTFPDLVKCVVGWIERPLLEVFNTLET